MTAQKKPEHFCFHCGQSYETKAKLETHAVGHVKEFHHQCCLCNMKFQMKFHLLIHKVTHKESKCNSCDKVFKTTLLLLNHYKSDHAENTRIIQCDLCEKEFSNFDKLFPHRASHFQVFKPKSKPILKRPRKRYAHSERKVYTCNFCGKQTFGKMPHLVHIRIHTGEKPFACDICNKRFRCETTKKSHMVRNHDQIGYHCELCTVIFKYKQHHANHLKAHSKLLSFVCDTCGKEYYSKHKLACNDGIHFGDKMKCDFCPKVFHLKNILKRHVTIAHSNVRPHKCTMCDKAFPLSSSLKKHYLSHTGEKPFSCEFCPKAFSSRYNWKVHIRIHTGEKPFTCDVCKTTFRVKSILKEHSKTHILEKIPAN